MGLRQSLGVQSKERVWPAASRNKYVRPQKTGKASEARASEELGFLINTRLQCTGQAREPTSGTEAQGWSEPSKGRFHITCKYWGATQSFHKRSRPRAGSAGGGKESWEQRAGKEEDRDGKGMLCLLHVWTS